MTKVSFGLHQPERQYREFFVRRLTDYLLEQHPSLEVEKIHIKDMVKEGYPFFENGQSFYRFFLPTYLRVAMVWTHDVEI